ncbi:hypothetical protein CERZMDRAFT_90066 [Cercospora zeae-maydis SCOH1-5]|uniref:Uncharacterized protein n=1 Tax=Cercospora zeae-maydis SCOH1-5 TaxID=717836 RepID=A0A6A6FS32_9PEZI|nr:hypothetical protein CERZMDRAFT_90066 [Cercospora zeae-maydis SCOH1-5]
MCAIAVFGCSLTSLAIYRGVGTVTICGVCSVLSSITVLAWLDIPARSSFAKLAVISALYGFASSGVQVYCLAGLYAFGQESNEVAGYRRMRGLAGRIFGWLPHPGFGSLTTVVSLTALVGNPLAGALIQSHRSTESAKILAGVTLLAGGFVLLASNYVRLAKT